jgi:hypothetical protein
MGKPGISACGPDRNPGEIGGAVAARRITAGKKKGRRKGAAERGQAVRERERERERESGPSWAGRAEEEGGPRGGKGGPRGVGLLGWFILFQTLFYLLF